MSLKNRQGITSTMTAAVSPYAPFFASNSYLVDRKGLTGKEPEREKHGSVLLSQLPAAYTLSVKARQRIPDIPPTPLQRFVECRIYRTSTVRLKGA
jgi:hypothetical protein